MHRRHVLQILGAALASASLTRCGEEEAEVVIATGPQCESPRAGTQNLSIAIVGAGVAGLTAAHALTLCGFTVTVFEAADRIGGRVYTTSVLGQPTDLGASWIHGGTANPLAALLNAPTLTTDLDSVALYDNGQRLAGSDVDQAYSQADAVLRKFDEIDENSDNDMSAAAAIEIARRERSPELQWALNSNIAVEYATDLDELSLWWGQEDSEFEGTDLLIQGGSLALLDAFSAGYTTELSSPVDSIEQDDQGVRLRGPDLDRRFDAVVCTVSAGVLQSGAISFSPDLSARKRTALQRIRMGTLDKTFLQFDEKFWPDATILGFVGAQTDGIGEFFDMSAQIGAPTLMGFSSGSVATALGQLSDEERVARAMDTLRTAFPSAPDPTDTLLSNWSREPLTLGSYVYLAVGGVPEDFLALASPVSDAVFLAGEHTDRDFRGSMHGAHFSGLRAAAQVVDRFGV
jgi:monoamine oxidase